eukprot:1184246-Prorocentrum_minimum.AAC.2
MTESLTGLPPTYLLRKLACGYFTPSSSLVCVHVGNMLVRTERPTGLGAGSHGENPLLACNSSKKHYPLPPSLTHSLTHSLTPSLLSPDWSASTEYAPSPHPIVPPA